jgi:hypothetical protein
MLGLNDEQRQAVSLKGLVYDDGEYPISEAYPHLDQVLARAGWDDPAMDVYDDYAPKERS